MTNSGAVLRRAALDSTKHHDHDVFPEPASVATQQEAVQQAQIQVIKDVASAQDPSECIHNEWKWTGDQDFFLIADQQGVQRCVSCAREFLILGKCRDCGYGGVCKTCKPEVQQKAMESKLPSKRKQLASKEIFQADEELFLAIVVSSISAFDIKHVIEPK